MSDNIQMAQPATKPHLSKWVCIAVGAVLLPVITWPGFAGITLSSCDELECLPVMVGLVVAVPALMLFGGLWGRDYYNSWLNADDSARERKMKKLLYVIGPAALAIFIISAFILKKGILEQ